MNPHPGHFRRSTKKAAAPTVTLKVFIGYGDVAAARHATTAIVDGGRASGRNVTLEPLLWRFAQLASSHWRDRALHAASGADVVVLACSSADAFTPAIEVWVNDLLAARRGRKTTLVAITGKSDAWTIDIEQPAEQAADVPEPAAASRLVA